MSVDDQLAAIWEEYPEAREFADLIQASDIETYTAVAKEIALKVRNVKAKESSSRTPKPKNDQPVSVKEAIENRSWPDYLAAKWEEAGRA